MRLRNALLLACASALIAGCGALGRGEQVVITATPNAVERAGAALPDAIPALTADVGAFENQTALLDGVCTEFLFSAAGETFVWDAPEALAAFYNRVDESELCRGSVARASFDFAGRVLAGAITAATGCDAAFRAGDVITSGDAQILPLELTVAPGCAYELVEPLVVAVPRGPSDEPLRVEVRGP